MGSSEKIDFPVSDRFKIIKQLGVGGVGVVYSAKDKVLGTTVALKTLKNADSESLFLLKKEFRALQDLQHPNLISFGELFENNGEWFFSMEYIDGDNFISHIRKNSIPGKISESSEPDTSPITNINSKEIPSHFPQSPSARSIPAFDESYLKKCLIQLSKGLIELHDTNRIHRDIKPGNIMVDNNGRVVLMDFGLVTESEENLNNYNSFFPVGTSDYMSPEQAASHALTPASDWYSVGVLLFRILTNRLPFEGPFVTVILEKQCAEAPSPDNYVKNLPPVLMDLCKDLLQFDPQKRPTGAEVIHRLQGETNTPKEIKCKSLTHTHIFIGRNPETEFLQEKYSRFLKGDPTSILIYGTSGLGKSEIIRNFIRDRVLRNDKTVVLSGRCYERESLSFKAFDPIIDSLSQKLKQLSKEDSSYILPENPGPLLRVFPVLSRVEAIKNHKQSATIIEDPQDIRAKAFQLLHGLFCRFAEKFPIILFIDDFQWADEDSNRLLQVLLNPSEAPKIFFIMSQRTSVDESTEHIEVRRTLEVIPSVVNTLEIKPLTHSESIEFATRLLEFDISPETIQQRGLDKIAKESGGHPLFIHELVRFVYTRENSQTGRKSLRLEEALWERISLLPLIQRHIVESVCVSGSPLSLTVLAKVLDTIPGKCLQYINQLRISNLIRISGTEVDRRMEPFHDKIRDAVLHRLANEDKRFWHHNLVTVLKTNENVTPEILAFHYEGEGEKTLARIHYTKAAHIANESLAFQRASSLFKKAIELWDNDEIENQTPLRELWLELAQCLTNAGRGQEAALTFLKALPGSLAAEALTIQRQAGELLLRSGHVDEGLEVIEAVLNAHNIKFPKRGWHSLVSLLWHRILLRFRGLKFTHKDESQISKELLARVDILRSVTDGMAMADHIKGADLGTRLLHMALNVGEPSRILEALCREASFISASGKANSSYHAKIISLIKFLLIKLNKPLNHGFVEIANSFREYMGGNWNQAYNNALKSINIFKEGPPSHWEIEGMKLVARWSLFYLGDLNEMGKMSKFLENDAMNRDDLLAASGNFLGLCNVVFLNIHGPDKARRDAENFISQWSTEGYHLQHYWHLLSDMHIDLYCGDNERAYNRISTEWQQLKKSNLLLLPAVRNEALYLRANSSLKMARISNGKDRSRFIKNAAWAGKRLRKSKLPWTRTLAIIIQAEILLLKGKEEAAVLMFHKAIEELEYQEMMLYASATKYKLGNFIGGENGEILKIESQQFFHKQNVKNHENMTRMLTP
jgi:eukaryotic-like serine/threonine-protein kinase